MRENQKKILIVELEFKEYQILKCLLKYILKIKYLGNKE